MNKRSLNGRNGTLNQVNGLPEKEVFLNIYRSISLIKNNDEQACKAIKSGRIKMIYYSPRGQEVIPSVISAILNKDDYICTIYRGSHDMLAKGVPLDLLWAEFAGRITGTCKGKGGPMHITHPESGCMITTGIVGSSMPIANGLALASQIKKDNKVTVAYFGDGASNIGAFHESLNMASVWKLPVVFVCQNNRFGEHTRFEKATAVEKVSDRAASYLMPGIHVDGNDPIAMYAAAKEAIERARSGGGPTLIEAMTFRFRGHVFGDGDRYMDKAEKEVAIRSDPVPRYRKWLVDQGYASEEDLADIDAKNELRVQSAIKKALDASWPDISELYKDILASNVAH